MGGQAGKWMRIQRSNPREIRRTHGEGVRLEIQKEQTCACSGRQMDPEAWRRTTAMLADALLHLHQEILWSRDSEGNTGKF